VTDWAEVYQPLIGAKLEALIWMPMTSDTPDVVRDLRSPSFSFTGGVFMAFEGKQLFLSWTQVGLNMVLGAGPEVAWRPYALDRVRASPEGDWAELEGAVLEKVELFSAPGPEGDGMVGVRHRVSREGIDHHFWVGTGGADFVGDNDDLWVGVGVELPNIADLTLVGVVA
jgi:hypothetical protein